ncbi:MAG: hypothetical protein IKA95_01615, partial [Clostridia bacterium]|nr:hypothetical protein [Clostridia bacterium]
MKLSSADDSNSRIIKELERNISLITNESGSVIEEIADIDKQKDNLRAKIAENEETVKAVKVELEAAQAEGSALAEKREDFAKSVTNEKIAYANIEKDIAVYNEKIELLAAEKQSAAVASIEKSQQKSN